MKMINIFKTFLLSLLLTFGLGASAQVATFPHTSDFEGAFGDWTNVTGDNGDWGLDQNGTPSSGTGPAKAAKGTWYVFTETSPNTTWNGQIWFECTYDMSTLIDASINFWYHMYASNGSNYGPGKLGLDVYDGTSWTYDVWFDATTNINAWQNANVDLSAYAGLSNVILSFTNYTITWQSDIALDYMVVDGQAGGGGGPPCATLPYTQDFETGATGMTGTTGTQSQVGVDATSANASLYGLHMQGNTSTSWSSSYSTGADAFNSSPQHIATASREICASTDPTLTLTFDIKQTYSYNSNYCWFRLTVDGTPVMDDQGTTYTNASSYGGLFKTLTYDLSAYANTDFTVAWEGCMKYYDQYYRDGDNIFVDNISLIEQTAGTPPGTPGTISGFTLPNVGAEQRFTIDLVSNATSYTWSVPSGWSINFGQGTEYILVTTTSTDGNVTVYATNQYGNSGTQSIAITTIEAITTFPDISDFEDEVQHSTVGSSTNFFFNTTGWRNYNTGDDGDWRADRGGTGSTTTGPGDGSASGQSDHNPGTTLGYYLYVESSTPNFPSKTFELWSPPYNLSALSSPAFTFWYSMHGGAGMGTLAIQASTDGGRTWSSDLNFTLPDPNATDLSGDQGTLWEQGFINLTSYTNETALVLRFKATTGTSFDSDIAIDNVQMMDMATTPITISGDIDLSTDIFSSSGSTVLISGTTTTLITSNGYQFQDLQINNSNGVTLDDNLDIAGSLTFTDGQINAAGNVVIVRGTAANAVQGGSSSSFIYGGILRRYIAANTGTYAFPVGAGSGPTNYFKVEMINNNMNLPGNDDFIQASVRSITESGNDIEANLNTSQEGTNIIYIQENSIWTLTPSMGGSFLSGSYGVNLYFDMTGVFDNAFTVVKRPSSSTTYADWSTFQNTTDIPEANQPGRTVASGYAQRTGFTAFSDFGGGGGGGPLPIELLYFNADVEDDIVILSWATVSQINNDYFTVGKSFDGYDFVEVCRVSGAGNANEYLSYTTMDVDPYYGTSYYRLTQTDYDGNFENFPLVSVNVNPQGVFELYPNPTESTIEITFAPVGSHPNYYNDAKIRVYTPDGRKIAERSIDGGWSKFTLNTEDYAKGLYILTISSGARHYQQSFIKR